MSNFLTTQPPTPATSISKVKKPFAELLSLIFTVSALVPIGADAIVNQPETTSQSAVVLLISSASPITNSQQSTQSLQSFSSCTGTFISESTIITAGHCVRDQQQDLHVYLALKTAQDSFRLIPTQNIKTNYQYEEIKDTKPEGAVCYKPDTPLFETQTTDIATLDVSNFKSSAWLPLSSEHPQAGQLVQVYGFGSTGNPFDGVGSFLAKDFQLRTFKSEVRKTSPQRLGLIARDTDAFAADGDSGGPVIQNGKIIAIMSTVSEYCETEFGSDYGVLNTATLIQK